MFMKPSMRGTAWKHVKVRVVCFQILWCMPSLERCEGGTDGDLAGGEGGNRPSDSEHRDWSSPRVQGCLASRIFGIVSIVYTIHIQP